MVKATSISLEESELIELQQESREMGMSLSAYLRQIARDRHKVSNNINVASRPTAQIQDNSKNEEVNDGGSYEQKKKNAESYFQTVVGYESEISKLKQKLEEKTQLSDNQIAYIKSQKGVIDKLGKDIASLREEYYADMKKVGSRVGLKFKE